MYEFSIGELVRIKDGPLADETCVIIGYGTSRSSNEPRYYLRFYGGENIDFPIKESNLEREI